MSKRLDPKDLSIQYVMTAPLEAATAFVETLAAVVKARARTAAAMNAARSEQAKNTATPARSSRSRARTGDIKLVDPNAPAPPATEAQQQPLVEGAPGLGTSQAPA